MILVVIHSGNKPVCLHKCRLRDLVTIVNDTRAARRGKKRPSAKCRKRKINQILLMDIQCTVFGNSMDVFFLVG